MSDETPTQTPTAAPPEPTAPAAAVPAVAEPTPDGAAAPAPAPVDTRSALERAIADADPDELVRLPKIAGILGSRQEAARRRWEAEHQAQVAADAAQAERERLKELRKNDPLAYAEAMETLETQAEAQAALARNEGESNKKWAQRVTRAYQDIPEFSQMDAADHTRLATAMANKDDEAALAAFNAEMAAILADKRAAVRIADAEKRLAETHDAHLKKMLAAEREAAIKQVRASILAEMGQPDLAKATTAKPSRQVDVLDWRDPKFEEAYKREVMGRSS